MPPETYRHSNKVLAPLRRNTWQSPCITACDLLAAVPVRTISGFSICVGSTSVIVEEMDLDSAAFVCPLRPLVGHLRATLLTGGVADQQTLTFPSVPLATQTERHRQAVVRGRP